MAADSYAAPRRSRPGLRASRKDSVASSSRKSIAKAAAAFPWRQAAIVAAVALLARILFWLPASRSLFMQVPVVDASFFDQWARALIDGRPFETQAFFKPPLAGYLLAALYRLGLGMPAVLVLQLSVGIVTSVLTFAVARLVFSPRIAFAGALAAAALPILPFFEAQMVAEAWTMALAQGSLLLFLQAVIAPARRGNLRFAASGVLLGLAALGRPNVLIVLPVLGVWLWRQGRAGAAPGRRAIVPVVLGCLFAISPATLHNLRYGEFVPVSANFGVNLYTGNSDGADGVSAIPVGVRWDGLQLSARQRGAVKPGAFSDLMASDSLKWMAAHPGQELQLLLKKTVLLLNAREGRNNINPRWLAEKEGVFVLARWWPGTWLLLPLAVAGLIFVPRDPRVELLRWLVVVQAAAILPFFAAARFRAPLLPLAALFAAAFVAKCLEWRRVDARRFALAAGTVAALFVVGNIDWYGLGAPRWLAQDEFNLGVINMRPFGDRQPDLAQAAGHLRRATELDPGDVDAHMRYGALLLMQARADVDRVGSLATAGRTGEAAPLVARAAPLLEQAAAHSARALEIYPRSHLSALNLGLCRLLQGELARVQVGATPTAADEPAALSALSFYAQAATALRTAATIDPSWKDPRQGLQDARRRALSVPAITPAVAAALQRVEAQFAAPLPSASPRVSS